MTADFVATRLLGVSREDTPPATGTRSCARCNATVEAPAKVCATCKEATYQAREQRKVEARRARGYARKCQHAGCDNAVATPQARNCRAHSNAHAPPAVGRVDTYAARVEVCPRCGGKIQRDGVLVSCRRRLACGWMDLTSKAIRGHGVAP